VELGIGAKVIGGVTLADNIRVGANAVVTKSFLEPGITIAGVPAVKVK
jgi:serine O-acetyltransferase